jgi:RNA polymerase sigma-70 factor (ECF subfamily)
MPDQEREARFRALLRAHEGSLRRLAASYAGATSEQEDLLQEIILAIWLALPNFRGESSEKTFLFRIAQNRCISHLAKRRRVDSLDDLEIDPADSGKGPDALASDAEQSDRLLTAVRRLPVMHRQVIVLALEDLDYREIGAVLGISENNVGVRLNRARAQLRELMEGSE